MESLTGGNDEKRWVLWGEEGREGGSKGRGSVKSVKEEGGTGAERNREKESMH